MRAFPARRRLRACAPPAKSGVRGASRSTPPRRQPYCRAISMSIRAKRRQANLAARFFLFIVAVAGLAVAGILAISLLPSLLAGQLGAGSPSLNPAERTLLAAYLAAHWHDLEAPAGADDTPVPFSVEAGATANNVAASLAQQG